MMEPAQAVREDQLKEEIHLEIRSVASTKSNSSNSTARSRASICARIKLETACARADYAKRESEIMIEKARIEARLKTLLHEKEAEAEANDLEAAEESENRGSNASARAIIDRTR